MKGLRGMGGNRLIFTSVCVCVRVCLHVVHCNIRTPIIVVVGARIYHTRAHNALIRISTYIQDDKRADNSPGSYY